MNLEEQIDQALNDGLLEHAKRLVRAAGPEQARDALDECQRLSVLTLNEKRTNSNRAILRAGVPLGEAWSMRRQRELDELRDLAGRGDQPPT